MIRAGIIGAAGYTGGELLRILLRHPDVTLAFAQSESNAGQPVWTVHADLLGETELRFCPDVPAECSDVIFLCAGHGRSRAAVEALPSSYAGRIIDLSADYRLIGTADGFVYGLPEAFRAQIRTARRIANPGCFATAIQLALLPLAASGILSEVHVTGITGSTGAGQKPQETTHFSWRANNLSVYKPFTHQHLDEIRQTLRQLDPVWTGKLNFVPVRGDFPRGILVSAYQDCALPEEEAAALYASFYKDAPFVHLCPFNPDLKMVTGTNKAVLHVRKHGDKLHVVSLIDNLCKGASGQAVQNMNLAFGLPETEGLDFKANRF